LLGENRVKAILLSALLLCLPGCATQDRVSVDHRVPLTEASLEKARRQCGISDVMLISPNVIRFSGLQEIGKPVRDYGKEMACLRSKLLIPERGGLTVITG
jgi:hypothetical protein